MQKLTKKRLVAVLVFLFMVFVIAGIIFFVYFSEDGFHDIDLYLFIVYMAIFLLGITIAFIQRMKEIKNGEEEESQKY